jgi:acetyltransferase-like isoleucine patch superfamily enzyme
MDGQLGSSKEPGEHWLYGPFNRMFQLLARILPGAQTVRVFLHRARGVRIGKRVWIGYDVILETSRPQLVTIEDDVSISMRATIIAHFKEFQGVKIERDVFIGPGVIILPGVTVGEGSVLKAGTVVSQSVPARTIVEGNPGRAVGRCEIPLGRETSLKEFARGVRPLVSKGPHQRGQSERHLAERR